MNVDDLLSVLDEKKTRRSEKITHLGLSHQPIIYEITVAEKEEHRKYNLSLKTEAEQDDDMMKVVIRSMCGWDEAPKVTRANLDKFKAIYSPNIIWELYRCVLDFGYLGAQGIANAKKN